MAAEQFFSMPPSTHIRISSSNSGFYDTVVDKKIFQYKYQLYTFAIMVALIRGAEPDTSTKNTDICLVGNVDEANFAVAKGLVAHISPDVKNGSELIKRMNGVR